MDFEGLQQHIIEKLQKNVKKYKAELTRLQTALDEANEKIQSPVKLGDKVYCIWDDVLLEDTVYAIGEDSFIVSCFGSDYMEETWEWYFADKDKTWFTDKNKALEVLNERNID